MYSRKTLLSDSQYQLQGCHLFLSRSVNVLATFSHSSAARPFMPPFCNFKTIWMHFSWHDNQGSLSGSKFSTLLLNIFQLNWFQSWLFSSFNAFHRFFGPKTEDKVLKLKFFTVMWGIHTYGLFRRGASMEQNNKCFGGWLIDQCLDKRNSENFIWPTWAIYLQSRKLSINWRSNQVGKICLLVCIAILMCWCNLLMDILNLKTSLKA